MLLSYCLTPRFPEKNNPENQIEAPADYAPPGDWRLVQATKKARPFPFVFFLEKKKKTDCAPPGDWRLA